jgi:hypothetical protein
MLKSGQAYTCMLTSTTGGIGIGPREIGFFGDSFFALKAIRCAQQSLSKRSFYSLARNK